MRRNSDDTTSATLPRINIPPIVPPTPEEIERRRLLVAKVRALREEIGATGMSTAELIQAAREADEEVPPALIEGIASSNDLTVGKTTSPPFRINLPSIPPPTDAELERRRQIVDRILARRDRIGPIGVSVTDLIREVREEADGIDE